MSARPLTRAEGDAIVLAVLDILRRLAILEQCQGCGTMAHPDLPCPVCASVREQARRVRAGVAA